MDLFLQDWFSHPNYWFCPECTYDAYLSSTYKHLLDIPWDPTSPRLTDHIGYIIVYDQLVRHVYRGNICVIEYYLEKALAVHKHIQNTFDVSELTPLEWVFYQLPIRHKGNPKEIQQLIQKTWQMILKEPHSQLLSFLKASYMRMPDNQLDFIEYYPPNNSNWHSYKDMLGYCPTHFEESIPPTLETLFTNFIKTYKLTHLIISVSGGVDSQFCCTILKRIQKTIPIELVGVYINYKNRDIRECEFVKAWCGFIELPLYIRSLDEIQRDPCMKYGFRTLYEDYTRKVRFNTYKNVWTDFLKQLNDPCVLLGHNQDDCFENILTNICHQNKYDNLKGMLEHQVLDDICFYRPMLSISKALIYEVAHHIGIPYLQDSTPSWSQRGQIRDTIRPTLTKWNSEMITSFFKLAERMQEYESISNMYIQSLLKNQISIEPTFSKLIWEKLFDKLKISCSTRSLNHFIDTLKRQKEHTKLHLNKYTKIMVNQTKEPWSIEIIHV
jgi:tRNA(Ile)-lysidine synthetase-like protein